MKLDGVMIWVPDAAATAAFYERAFGLAIEMLDEQQGFAMMRTGDTTLQFADERAAGRTGVTLRLNRPDEPAAAAQLALVADDVDAAWATAVAAGAVPEVEIASKPWGQRLGYLRDINGFLVELSSPAAW